MLLSGSPALFLYRDFLLWSLLAFTCPLSLYTIERVAVSCRQTGVRYFMRCGCNRLPPECAGFVSDGLHATGFTLTTICSIFLKSEEEETWVAILKRLERDGCLTQDIVGRKGEMSRQVKKRALLILFVAQCKQGENETRHTTSRRQAWVKPESYLSPSVASCDETEG